MNSKKIIIVDDDTAILGSLSMILDFEGFTVCACERGSEILPYLESVSRPDVIVLDIWLSGEDGRDICKQLKANESTKNIPVVMMSAARDLEITAYDSGATAFIAKPFEMEKVVDTLYQLTS